MGTANIQLKVTKNQSSEHNVRFKLIECEQEFTKLLNTTKQVIAVNTT